MKPPGWSLALIELALLVGLLAAFFAVGNGNVA